MSVLKVTGINCQLTGNYTCVTANQFGSVQRQLTLSILGKYKKNQKGEIICDRVGLQFFFRRRTVGSVKERLQRRDAVPIVCGENVWRNTHLLI